MDMSNKKTELSHKKVLTLIESMQQLLDDATNIPLSRKVAIDKEYALEILNDIKIALPNQFKQAEHVYDTKDTIIKEAHAEAEAILEKTREYAKEKISIYSKIPKVIYDIFCKIKIINKKMANKNEITKVPTSLIFSLLSIGINISKASVIKFKQKYIVSFNPISPIVLMQNRQDQ